MRTEDLSSSRNCAWGLRTAEAASACDVPNRAGPEQVGKLLIGFHHRIDTPPAPVAVYTHARTPPPPPPLPPAHAPPRTRAHAKTV